MKLPFNQESFAYQKVWQSERTHKGSFFIDLFQTKF